MKHILGTKEGMTQVFAEDGKAFSATIVRTGPMTVLGFKEQERDGYDAVVVGFGERKQKRVSQAVRGQVQKILGKDAQTFAVIKEFRISPELREGLSVGDTVDLSMFNEGDVVAVSGFSKGKGFQGAVKRHGFAGGRRSHGQKHSEREVGSIGATGPQRVFKGMRMPGRMGNTRVTVKNLHIVSLDAENNRIVVSGAVPGRRGTTLEIVGV